MNQPPKITSTRVLLDGNELLRLRDGETLTVERPLPAVPADANYPDIEVPSIYFFRVGSKTVVVVRQYKCSLSDDGEMVFALSATDLIHDRQGLIR